MDKNWHINNHKLEKEFVFNNFEECVAFVYRILPITEKINHHPDVLIHAYKKVKFFLFTHTENKITSLDYQLAKQIDKLFLDVVNPGKI